MMKLKKKAKKPPKKIKNNGKILKIIGMKCKSKGLYKL